MICPSCGHEIDDDAAFCTECGARIDQPAAPEPDEPAPAKKRPLSVAQKAAIAGLVVFNIPISFVEFCVAFDKLSRLAG